MFEGAHVLMFLPPLFVFLFMLNSGSFLCLSFNPQSLCGGALEVQDGPHRAEIDVGYESGSFP